jgi:type IV secretion system protein VirD4
VNPDFGIRLGYKLDGEPRIYRGDSHILTVAPTRAGKGTDLLIPALLTYQGSCLVVDPKGQLCAVTARRRQELGQKVVVLNPFKLWQDYIGRFQHVGFNPLASLNPASNLASDCQGIAEAIVLQDATGDNARFFTNSARQLVTGLLMYLVQSSDYGPEKKNLVQLYDMLREPDVYAHAIEAVMLENDLIKTRLGRYAVENAMERKSTGEVVSTAMTECDFMGVEAIRESLKSAAPGSYELRFRDLRRQPMTVYLILPTEYLGSCAKWFRLVVERALFDLLHTLQDDGPGLPVLMMMDEFAQLKRLQIIEEALAGAAGFGVMLWPVLQDLTQLKELYKDRWETFIGNSGISTWYPPRENTTADYVSKMCGETEIGREKKTINMQPGSEGMPGISIGWEQTKRPLFLPEEICGRGSNPLRPDEMLIFAAKMPKVIRGKRVPYFKDTAAFEGMYDPDPYPHPGKQQSQKPQPANDNRGNTAANDNAGNERARPDSVMETAIRNAGKVQTEAEILREIEEYDKRVAEQFGPRRHWWQR